MANVTGPGPGMETLPAAAMRAVRRAIAEVRREGGGQAQVAAGKGLNAYAFSTGENLVWEYAANDGAPIAAGTVPLIKPDGEPDDSTEDDEVAGEDESADDDGDQQAAAQPSTAEADDEELEGSAEIASPRERAIFADVGLEALLDLTEDKRAELFAELERAIASKNAIHLLRFGSEAIASAELCRRAREQNFTEYMNEGWADRLLFLNRCREN